MQYSLTGLRLTESFEGCRLTAYYDAVGVLTIGYGHTGPDVYPGQIITQAQAETLLLSDVQTAVACVNGNVRVALTQNEFDSLVDFTFNEGVHSFESSTLLRDLNAGNYAAAASQFSAWVMAGGRRLEDLVRRRQAEANLFVR
jgi:lysozyme